MILAIDLSLNHFGYSVLDEHSNLIEYKAVVLSNKLDKKGIDREKFIYSYFKDLILKLKENNDSISMVLEEIYLSINKKTSLQLQSLYGMLMGIAIDLNVKFFSYSASETRTIFNIKGKEREKVKKAIDSHIKILYPEVQNDKEFDISDSIALGLKHINYLESNILK